MNRSSTSPFRGISSRVPGSQSLQLMIKSLQQENNCLVDQINTLKLKINKMIELQDKNEMILRHNTQLLNENQRLAKLINQKKSQIQTWKNKHDNILANRSTASDLQIKRLLTQIDKLKQQINQIQHNKNLYINQIKNQQHVELQNIKRNSLGSIQKYQLEIRKYKQYCDKKDYQISDYKMKITRMNKQMQFEITKLREQKQRLRNDMQYQQNQHKKQIQSLKNKYDYNYHNQIQNTKKQHLNQIQSLDYQNVKLKEVINSKNMEVEQCIIKNNKMRNHYEDALQVMKKQNNECKQKLIENEHLFNLQLNNLRQKLDGIKQSELALLKDTNTNQQDILVRQIQRLKKYLTDSNTELETILRQKNLKQKLLEGEIKKLQNELKNKKIQNKQIESKYQSQIIIYNDQFKNYNDSIKNNQILLHQQISRLQQQRQILKKQLLSKNQQFILYQNNTQLKENKLQNQISFLKNQNVNAKDQIQKIYKKYNQDTQVQKIMYQHKIKQLESKVQGVSSQGNQKDNIIIQLQNNIQILKSELNQSDQKIKHLQNTESQLRNQLRDNFSRSLQKQKQLNRLIRDQIDLQQKRKKTQLQQIKQIYENKLKTLQHHIHEQQKNIKQKNKIINDIKLKYDQLVNNFLKIFSQEASRKNLDIKVPGWLPDLLAIKSLFDVFLKNKVIQYCQ